MHDILCDSYLEQVRLNSEGLKLDLKKREIKKDKLANTIKLNQALKDLSEIRKNIKGFKVK